MEVEKAIEHALNGNAMLFLGAGFSYDAKNHLDRKLGAAKELSHELCKEMRVKEKDNLSQVSNYYIKNNESNVIRLIEKLQDYFICNTYEPYHAIIADIEWLRVYTTNYDDVFEKAAREVNPSKNIRTKTLKDSTRNITKENAIIHLNGYIRNLTEDKLENEFKLTTKSYMVDEFLESEWCGLFKLDISNAGAIIFIGTSFEYDLDLQRIFYANRELKEKTIFIDLDLPDDEIDEISDSNRLDFGQVHRIGVDGFADKIKEVRIKHTKTNQEIEFRCFDYINLESYEYAKPTIRSKWDLLVTGKIDEKIIESNYENDEYIFNRNIINYINNNFDNNMNTVVVHSNLGEGKTCFIEKYCQQLKTKGQVFKLQNRYNSINKEIVEISKIKGTKYIVIENYNYHLDVLQKFKPFISDEYKFILTARTFINESVYYKLPYKLGVSEDSIFKVSLNGLKDNEVQSLINLLDSSTIWTDYVDGKDINKKDSIIKTNCNSNLSEVLLEIVKSESVSKKIRHLYKEISKNPIKKDLLLGVIVNSAAALDLNLNDITNVIGINSISLSIERDENLNELIDLRENCIKGKSSILARYIIEQNNLSKDILEVMKRMVINANKMRFGEKNKNIIRQLISISNINEIIKDKSKRVKNQVVEYFDSLNMFQCYKDLPFFWLQYGMACLDAKQFDRADKYFKVAYKKAEEIKYYFDTYQIDTQYARYIMENAIYDEVNKVEEPYNVLKKSHDILIQTLYKRRGQSYYIFKQVPTYYDFIKKFKNQLSMSDKNNIIKLCDEMEKKIFEYKNTNKNNDLISPLFHAEKAIYNCKKEVLLTVI